MSLEEEILTIINESITMDEISSKLAILCDKCVKQGISFDTFVNRTIVLLRKSNITVRDVSDILAISYSNISIRIKKMREQGIEIPGNIESKKNLLKKQEYRKKENDEIDKKIIDDLSHYIGVYEIAENLNMTKSAVYSRINRMKKRGMNIPWVGQLPKKPTKTRNDRMDDYIKNKIENGASYKEISKDLNISHQRVSQRVHSMRKRGVDIPIATRGQKPRTESDDIDAEIAKKLAENETISQIANDLGVDRKTIKRRIKKMDEREKTMKENKKRAIVFDLDETLETASVNNSYTIMTLRPNIDALISKLKEAKEQGIDIILCSSATQSWINRFFELKPEFKDLFDKIYCMNNFREWYLIDEQKNPIEYKANQKANNSKGKPVTTFGYDSILFIDDNTNEYEGLRELFEIAKEDGTPLEKDVTYFSGYGFKLPEMEAIFNYIKFGQKDPKFNQYLSHYINLLRNENGIAYICAVIDDYMSRNYTPGLKNRDQLFSIQHQDYDSQTSKDFMVLGKICNEYCSQHEFNQFIMDYLKSNKHFPFEGIEEYVNSLAGRGEHDPGEQDV